MENVNLCEACGREAAYFGLRGNRKTRSCRDHLDPLLNKKMQIFDMEGYDFVSSLQDVSIFEERKTQVVKGRGNLTALEAICDQEVTTALKAIEYNKSKAMKALEHRFEEIKAKVIVTCSKVKTQFSQLEVDFNKFLNCKESELTPTALLLCSEMTVTPQFLNFDIADVSDSISAILDDCWTVGTADIHSTLHCLSAGMKEKAIEGAFAEAKNQAQKGIQRALQYANSLIGDDPDYDDEKSKVLSELFKHEKVLIQQNLKWLEHSWELRQQCEFADKEVVEVGRRLAVLLYRQFEQFSRAEEILRDCFNIANKQSHPPELSMSLCNELCGVYFVTAQYQQLDQLAVWVLETFETANLPAGLCWTTLLYLTYSKQKQSKDQEASALLENWRKRNLTDESPFAEMLRLVTCGFDANYSEKKPEVMKMLSQAKDIGTSNFPTSQFTALALFRLASLYEGDSREKYHRQAESIYQVAAPKSAQAANNLSGLGNFYSEKKSEKDAENCYLLAKSILADIAPTSIDAAVNLSKMSIFLQKSGRWNESEQCYRQAQSIFEITAPNSIQAAANLGNLGIFLKGQGRFDEAEACYLKVQSIYEVADAKCIEAAKNLYNLGLLDIHMGRLVEAKNSFLQASVIYESAGPKSIHAANNLSILGDLHWKAENLVEAERCYRLAESIYESTASKSDDAANTYFHMGLLFEAMEQPAQALDCMEKSAAIYSEINNAAAKLKVEKMMNSIRMQQCVVS